MKKSIVNENCNYAKSVIAKISSTYFDPKRNLVSVDEGKLDECVKGYFFDSMNMGKNIIVTTIPVPGAEHIVFVYNKTFEDYVVKEIMERQSESWIIDEPCVIIPETNVELYTRSIVCRINSEGGFEGLKEEDIDIFAQYLDHRVQIEVGRRHMLEDLKWLIRRGEVTMQDLEFLAEELGKNVKQLQMEQKVQA